MAVGNVSEAAHKRNDSWPGYRLDNNWFHVLQEVSSSAESVKIPDKLSMDLIKIGLVTAKKQAVNKTIVVNFSCISQTENALCIMTK